MLWIYQMPLWALALLVTLVIWAYSVGGVIVFRPWVSSWKRAENESVGYLLSIAGVAYAVLLAMIAVGAWNGSSAVDVAIQQEANALAGISRAVGGFHPEARDHFRELVREYVDFVVRDEWPALGRNARSPRTELASQTLADEIVQYKPVNAMEEALKGTVVDQMLQFETARRLRILTGERGLDAVTWFVVLLGGLATLAFVFFLRVDSLKVHVLLTMLASGMIAVVVFLILAMDHPLWGEVSVRPEALQEVLHSMTDVPKIPTGDSVNATPLPIQQAR
jgi:hypothetical protein